jgi:diguanylate cyclase (GGDEF)-like protein/PAS domain S-box-containing protein
MLSSAPEDKRTEVLVVDDDAAVRLLSRKSLEQNGFEVREAADGAQGILAFERFHPDLLMLDVLMPDTDGFTVCETIRKLPGGSDIPILIMTGLDDTDSVNRAYQAGATDFITKPINWVLLIYRVLYILRASRANKELRKNKARLSTAQRIAQLGHWDWDIRSNRFYWSEELHRIFGLPPDGGAPTAGKTFVDFVHPEDLSSVKESVKESILGRRGCSIDYRIMLGNGSVRYVHHQAEVVGDETGRAAWVTGTIQDITERKRAEEQISFLAYYDSLTRLPNRVLFKKYLAHELAYAERYDRILGILFLDLDLFKRFNDTLGHSVGDLLLKAVAERLVCSVRESDCVGRQDQEMLDSNVARLGGDEFVVLLSKLKQVEDAARVARRILQAFSKPFTVDSHEVFITASIGVSVYPHDAADIEGLLKNADTAMYHAKSEGRNNYQFYTESLNSAAFARLALESNLRRAVECQELVLSYQPKFRTRSGEIMGMEALLRWRHPELGLILPSDFIPLAEEMGLIMPIGEMVLRAACAQNKAWQSAGFSPVSVAVNLSNLQFKNPQRLMDSIVHALDSSGLDPCYLELELTESMVMQNEAVSISTLRELKKMGLTIAIDDFGTGYSSLSYLRQFPVDALKIDRTFVKGIPGDKDNSAITSAIIVMSHSLNLKAIAEGVETEEQLAFLREQNCDEAQGFLLGPPMYADELTNLLKTGKYL